MAERFEPGDRVITPTDEVARVVDVDVAVLELQYVEALNAETARFELRASLCVPWPHGRPRPSPFRVRRG